jgi:hypothetical protein
VNFGKKPVKYPENRANPSNNNTFPTSYRSLLLEMVFFFTTKNPAYVIYMGKDKYENEDLIKYGFPEDIW